MEKTEEICEGKDVFIERLIHEQYPVCKMILKE